LGRAGPRRRARRRRREAKAFLKAFTELSTRINYLLALPIEKLDRLALKARLDDIGRRTSVAFEADPAV
jgi:hypothetical protein